MVPPDEAGVTLTCESAASVRHDPGALSQAVLNLLVNAYKYSSPPRRIAVTASDEALEVMIAVEDNGIGIPPREIKRIFEPFYACSAQERRRRPRPRDRAPHGRGARGDDHG